jgi:aspartyl protease family protein
VSTITSEWQEIALYAAGAALLIMLLQRIPVVGRIIRFVLSFGLLAFCIFLLLQQAPYEPNLAKLTSGFGIDGQQVVGDEMQIRIAPDGHFWANVTVNGVKRRMLIDSGATITAISQETATAASVGKGSSLVPVVLQTANGAARAETGTVEKLNVGSIEARNLKVVISPALGRLDVLGMNFLSKLASCPATRRKPADAPLLISVNEVPRNAEAPQAVERVTKLALSAWSESRIRSSRMASNFAYASLPPSVAALPFLFGRPQVDDGDWNVRTALAAALAAERADHRRPGPFLRSDRFGRSGLLRLTRLVRLRPIMF